MDIELTLSRVWMADGNCLQYDPDMMFPNRTQQAYTHDLQVKVCGPCPVREICLDYAVMHREEHGIWGGLNAYQLKKLYRKLNQKAEIDRVPD